jgi:hypothetical protein
MTRGERYIRDQVYGVIEAGSAARAAGEPLTANPHPRGTYFASLWHDGWVWHDGCVIK